MQRSFILCSIGGKDYLVKLWDAKSGRELSSLSVFFSLPYFVFLIKVLCYNMVYICSHGHKNIVHCVKWNQNGNWVLTASKDQIIKVRGLCFCNLFCFLFLSSQNTLVRW